MTQMNVSMKQKQNQGHREQTGGCLGGRRWQRAGLGVWISGCKLVCIERISKVLLYSTWNCIQYPVKALAGKNMKKNVYICIIESLCHTVVISTTL